MDSLLRRKLSWAAIAALSVPALGLFGYSLRHPGVRGKDDRLFPIAAQAAAAKAASASSATSPWMMQDSGTTAGLRGIYSVDGKIAWASGTSGTVLRTVDGGENWAKCAVPDGDKDGSTLDFRGVQAWDASIAIVMSSGPGEKSRLYKTQDGCGTWKLIFENPDKDGFWDGFRLEGGNAGKRRHGGALLFGDPVHGHFPVWRIDRDDSAFQVEPHKHLPKARPHESAFAASNSAIFVESDFHKFWIATGGANGGRVIRQEQHLSDEFTWFSFPSVQVPVGAKSETSGIFSLAFSPSTNPRYDHEAPRYETGVAVGGDYVKPNEGTGTAAWTNDGGLHWTASSKLPHGYRSSVAWSEERKAWIAAGTNGSDISRDDGKTWEPLDDGNWNALSLPFVVGPQGRIGRLAR